MTGKRIEVETDDDGIGGHFLNLLHGKAPSELHARVMDVSLILYAEHEFNASTFTARGLRINPVGHAFVRDRCDRLPARPAARRRQMRWPWRCWRNITRPSRPARTWLRMLAAKEKIMGFGHAVYPRKKTPRNAIIREWSRKAG